MARQRTKMHDLPSDLKYSSTHTWVEMIEDGLLRVGITDFAQSELGDVVFVELPEIEREYTSGDECAVVESVKSTSDIYCPVSGSIIEVNDALSDSPELINGDPYGEGWIFTIEPIDHSDLDDLLDAEAYSELTEEN